MDARPVKVLLIEDNPGDAELLRMTLLSGDSSAFSLVCASSLSEALPILAAGDIDIILLDLSLPEAQGHETFVRVHTQTPQVPIIVLSGLDDEALALKTVQEGAQDYLVKGHIDRHLLLRAIRYSIERERSEKALRQSESFYHSLVESLPQNILRKDLQGHFTFANQRAAVTMRTSLDQIVGKTDYDYFPHELAEKYRCDDRWVIETGKNFETVEEHVTPTGERLYVRVVKTPIFGYQGEILGTQAIFWDVTEEKLAERRLAAQHAITAVLAESVTLVDVAPKIVQAICDSLDWELGAIWRVDDAAKLVRCVEIWHQPGMDFSEFEDRTRNITFPPGVGLPGRVWSSGEPAWIADVTKDMNFPRAPFAVKVGLHGAFGLPILLQSEVLGVIEFFSREIRKPDDAILTMMGAIGSQIGQFIERKRTEDALRESQQRLQSIMANAPAVIYVKDLEGRYLMVNRQYENLFHIPLEHIPGRSEHALFPKQYADAFRANDLKVLAAGVPMEFEEIAPQDDGLHTYISVKFPLVDASGKAYAVCGISTDITQRKRAEDALMHERYLLHTLMDNVPDSIYFKDAQSRFIRINRSLAQKNGLANPNEAIGRTDFDFFTEEHARPALEDEHEVMRTGRPLIGKEESETWPDGHVTWVLTTKLPLRDLEGKTVGTFGISRDITKRKEAEQALRDSEALYHSLVESLPLNVFRKDLEGRVILANSMYCRTLGLSPEHILGKTDHDLFPKELADKYRADDRKVTESGALFETVEEHETPKGERLFVQVLKCPVHDSTGAIVGTQVIFWDVTARKRAQETLQDSERRYRQFTEGSQDGIVVANQQGLITLFNAAAQKIFGYTEAEVLGKPVTILMPTEFQELHREGFARYLATREAHVVGRTVELRGRRKTGDIFHLDLSLTALDLPEGISFLAAIRDTTERHRMHARVTQAEKMASLGLLSAGVAHEINNPIAYIANNLAVLDRDICDLRRILDVYEEALPEIALTQPDKAKKIAQIKEEIDVDYVNQNLERILKNTRQGVKRVADIVQSLRGFVRGDQVALERVDIHESIQSSLELVRHLIERRNITIEENRSDVPNVYCSPSKLKQVFLNLFDNALKAIEASRKPNGRIEISTRSHEDHVIVEIADNGCGIPPELVSMIFDPFFTTQKTGEGIGLGLSITHGIVRDHDGDIEVESKVGEGTRFRVILPINPKKRES